MGILHYDGTPAPDGASTKRKGPIRYVWTHIILGQVPPLPGASAWVPEALKQELEQTSERLSAAQAQAQEKEQEPLAA